MRDWSERHIIELIKKYGGYKAPVSERSNKNGNTVIHTAERNTETLQQSGRTDENWEAEDIQK